MRKHILAAVIFLVFIAVMTYPLVFHVAVAIPGFSSTDEPFGALWNSWRIKQAFWNGESLARTSLVAFPFGVTFFSHGIGMNVGTFWNHFLSACTTPVLAWNIQVIINLLSSAFFTYLLTVYLTGSWPAGIFAGLAFAFCPYQITRTWQHLGLTYNQCIPLLFLGAILLKERPSRVSFALFMLAFLALFSFDYSVTYIGFTGFCVFLAFAAASRDTAFLKRAAKALAVVALFLSPQVIPIVINRLLLSGTTQASVFNTYRRPFEDLFSQSARPLSFLLPSPFHPFLGRVTETFIGSNLYGTSLTEHSLYLGWTTLFLALYAWRLRKKYRREEQGESRDLSYTRFFFILAVVAWFFSQPPLWRVGSLKIPMPSLFLYKVLPMYRAYGRFGILLAFSLSVLAAYGFRSFMRTPGMAARLKGVFLCGLILFEFWCWPPYKLIDVSQPPAVYAWLKDQPGEVLSEYPLDVVAPNETYKFYQIFHGMKITNGATPGTPSNELARSAALLSSENAVGVLRKMGVRYAVVHHDGYLLTGLAQDREELTAIRLNPDLELLRSFPAQECTDKRMMCVRAIGRVDVYVIKDRAGATMNEKRE